MRRSHWTRTGSLLVALACVALVGCKDDKDDAKSADTEASRALWSTLQSADYPGTWTPGPGYEAGPIETVRAHRDTARVYLNDIAAEALATGPAEAWPEGSVLVKDSFDAGRADVVLVSAMQKGTDGWFLVEWDADGKALYSGRPDICVECHGSGKDLVKAFDITAPPPE